MVNFFTKFISMILVFVIMNFSPFFSKNSKPDIDTISENITNDLLDGTMSPYAKSDIETADDVISRIAYNEKGDCFFSDIDYSNPNRTVWPAAIHLARTEKFAILYRLENDSQRQAEYREIILNLIDFWIDKDYVNDNWWHNQLSNPNILGELGILMKDDLDSDRLFKLSQLVGRGSFTVDPLLLRFTGANAVEIAMSTIKFGVLTGSGSAIKTAAHFVSNELDYSVYEGLKKDSTYFQHGRRIYMGGYGISYIKGVTEVISMLSGTRYIFSDKQLIPFTNFILDGLRIMSFGSTLDPTTMGRSVSRPNSQPLPGLVPSLNKLASIPEMPRKNELKSYADSITNDTKYNYGLNYFNESKFLVINNSDFYFSFRGGDNLMFYSEKMNNENFLAYNSSFPGVTTIMHTGKELSNISPLYNYSLVPGTTAVYENDQELAAHKDFTYRALPGVYGSKAKENAAVAFAKTSHDGIDMAISCFATDNAAVLLGAGLKDAKGRQMFTTLDQAFASGEFFQSENVVINNGIKYTVLQGENPVASKEYRNGDWGRNNLTFSGLITQGEVFTLFVPNNGSYAYSVMSENTDAEFKVIVNTDKVQAVQLPDGRIAASFFSKCEFEFSGKIYKGKAGSAYIFDT